MKKLSLVLDEFAILGCTSNSKDGITGKWKMNKVIQEGQVVTEEYNPHHERYLILKPDSSFESGGRPFGKKHGDIKFWQGYGSEWTENYQLIQIRNSKWLGYNNV